MKVTITDDVNESYNEILNGLKEKYSQMIFARIDSLKERCYGQLSRALDNDLKGVFEETQRLKTYCDKEKKAFYRGDDYKNAQRKLVELKAAVSASSDDEQKKEAEKALAKAMDRISTLNVTINNRLKSHKDKINSNIEIIKHAVSSDSGLFARVKDEFLNEIDAIIKDGVLEFNRELKPIKEQFGKNTDEIEFPFSENTIKVQMELFPSVADDNQSDNGKFIVSKNENTTKN